MIAFRAFSAFILVSVYFLFPLFGINNEKFCRELKSNDLLDILCAIHQSDTKFSFSLYIFNWIYWLYQNAQQSNKNLSLCDIIEKVHCTWKIFASNANRIIGDHNFQGRNVINKEGVREWGFALPGGSLKSVERCALGGEMWIRRFLHCIHGFTRLKTHWDIFLAIHKSSNKYWRFYEKSSNKAGNVFWWGLSIRFHRQGF